LGRPAGIGKARAPERNSEIFIPAANRGPFGDTKEAMNSLKTSLKICTLVAICGSGFGLVTLSTGCAATATKESTGEYVDDATITAKVKAAFVKDEVVKAFDVSVETFKGNVQLSGFVDTAEEKARAVQIARGIDGVRDVQNKITVK